MDKVRRTLLFKIEGPNTEDENDPSLSNVTMDSRKILLLKDSYPNANEITQSKCKVCIKQESIVCIAGKEDLISIKHIKMDQEFTVLIDEDIRARNWTMFEVSDGGEFVFVICSNVFMIYDLSGVKLFQKSFNETNSSRSILKILSSETDGLLDISILFSDRIFCINKFKLEEGIASKEISQISLSSKISQEFSHWNYVGDSNFLFFSGSRYWLVNAKDTLSNDFEEFLNISRVATRNRNNDKIVLLETMNKELMIYSFKEDKLNLIQSVDDIDFFRFQSCSLEPRVLLGYKNNTIACEFDTDGMLTFGAARSDTNIPSDAVDFFYLENSVFFLLNNNNNFLIEEHILLSKSVTKQDSSKVIEGSHNQFDLFSVTLHTPEKDFIQVLEHIKTNLTARYRDKYIKWVYGLFQTFPLVNTDLAQRNLLSALDITTTIDSCSYENNSLTDIKLVTPLEKVNMLAACIKNKQDFNKSLYSESLSLCYKNLKLTKCYFDLLSCFGKINREDMTFLNSPEMFIKVQKKIIKKQLSVHDIKPDVSEKMQCFMISGNINISKSCKNYFSLLLGSLQELPQQSCTVVSNTLEIFANIFEQQEEIKICFVKTCLQQLDSSTANGLAHILKAQIDSIKQKTLFESVLKEIQDLFDHVQVKCVVAKYLGEDVNIPMLKADDRGEALSFMICSEVFGLLSKDFTSTKKLAFYFKDSMKLNDYFYIFSEQEFLINVARSIASANIEKIRFLELCNWFLNETLTKLELNGLEVIYNQLRQEAISLAQIDDTNTNDTIIELIERHFWFCQKMEEVGVDTDQVPCKNLSMLVSTGMIELVSLAALDMTTREYEYSRKLDLQNCNGCIQTGILIGLSPEQCLKAYLQKIKATPGSEEDMHSYINEFQKALEDIAQTNRTQVLIDFAAFLTLNFTSDQRLIQNSKRHVLLAISCCNNDQDIYEYIKIASILHLLSYAMSHTDEENELFLDSETTAIELRKHKETFDFKKEQEMQNRLYNNVFPVFKESWTFIDKQRICSLIKETMLAVYSYQVNSHASGIQCLEEKCLELLYYLENNSCCILAMAAGSMFNHLLMSKRVTTVRENLVRKLTLEQKKVSNIAAYDTMIFLPLWLSFSAFNSPLKSLEALQNNIKHVENNIVAAQNLLMLARIMSDLFGIDCDRVLSNPISRTYIFLFLQDRFPDLQLAELKWKTGKIDDKQETKNKLKLIFRLQDEAFLKLFLNIFDFPLDILVLLWLENIDTIDNFGNDIVKHNVTFTSIETAITGSCGTDHKRILKLYELQQEISPSDEIQRNIGLLQYILGAGMNEFKIDFFQLVQDSKTFFKNSIIGFNNLQYFLGLARLTEYSHDEILSKVFCDEFLRGSIDIGQFREVLERFSNKDHVALVVEIILEKLIFATTINLEILGLFQEYENFLNQKLRDRIILEYTRFSVTLKTEEEIGTENATLCFKELAQSNSFSAIFATMFELFWEHNFQFVLNLFKEFCAERSYDHLVQAYEIGLQWISLEYGSDTKWTKILEYEKKLIDRTLKLLSAFAGSKPFQKKMCKELLTFCFKNATSTYLSKSRGLEILFMLFETDLISEVVQETNKKGTVALVAKTFQYYQYMIYIDRLNLSYSLGELMNCEKLGMVKSLWRDNKDNEIALELIVCFIIDFELYDDRIVNAVLKQVSDFGLEPLQKRLEESMEKSV